MSQENQFDRLEQFVNTLLTQYEQLLAKNMQLQSQLQQRQEEIEKLRDKVDSADSERGDISNRIKGLIDQIEGWQSAIGGQTENEIAADGESEAVNEAADELSADDGDGGNQERESGQQRKLFQVGPEHDDTFRD